MNNLINSFLDEANELISDLEDSLLTLEEMPTDKEAVNHVFRVMHTLKGSGGMFGFNSVSDFTHHLESIYYNIRNGDLVLSKEILTLTLQSVDLIKELLKSPDQIPGKVQFIYDDLIEKIGIVTSDLDMDSVKIPIKSEAIFRKNGTNPQKQTNTYYIHFEPKPNILQNGTNPLYLIDELIALGEAYVILHSENIPKINEIILDECYVSWEIVLATHAEIGDIKDVFIFVEDESNIEVQDLAEFNLLKHPEFLNSIKNSEKQKRFIDVVELQKLAENILSKDASNVEIEATEVLTKLEIEKKTVTTEPIAKEIIANEALLETNTSEPNQNTNQAATSTIRVSSKKIDELMNLVSEMVTSQARLNLLSEKIQNPELSDAVENLEKLTRQLRDNAFEISLIPIKSMLTRFKRLIRDLSAEVKKDVNFSAEGDDTELDKTIIENLSDPLMHIFRNAIDHGIEDKEIRKAKGKPETGHITLKAFYSGTNVYIQIIDDGAGIDPEIIRKKAIQKGLIGANDKLSKSELIEFITMPGFSTAEAITEISGRGVGMDVVKKNIQKIQGELMIDSTLDVGTTFTLKLPLTLSIIDGLIVTIENTSYIIPIPIINKIRPLEHTVIENSFNNTLVIDNEQIPFIYLRQHFGITSEAPEREQMVVVNFENQRMGIIIDQVEKKAQVVVKSIGKQFHHHSIISGASILGNGHVALVLDTFKIINSIKK